MPAPGSNRGYLNSAVLNTFMLMKHEGGKFFDDIRILLQESELMNLRGLSYMPTAKTIGNWLHRIGSCKPSMRALGEVNKRVIKSALHHRQRVMLIPITEGKRPVGTRYYVRMSVSICRRTLSRHAVNTPAPPINIIPAIALFVGKVSKITFPQKITNSK